MKPITVDGGKGTVELDAEGVPNLVWKPGTVLVAADVHAAMAKVNEVADGAEYPMLIDIANTQAVTRQAKSVFSVRCAASRIALLGVQSPSLDSHIPLLDCVRLRSRRYR
jgi:hypothetical protein